jgi:peroxiredoxin
MIKPRQPVPDLQVDLVGGGRWSFAARTPEHFTMIVVYRGLHCPICSTYLADLNAKADDFRTRGVRILVLSTDDAGRAERARQDWGLDALDVGYGLSIEEARRWGLFISSGRGATSAGVEEPGEFAEPGLFYIRPDGTLYFASIQTMPFARPAFADILKATDFVIARDYPARGEL